MRLIKLQYNEQSGEVSAKQLENEKFAHEYSVKVINQKLIIHKEFPTLQKF